MALIAPLTAEQFGIALDSGYWRAGRIAIDTHKPGPERHLVIEMHGYPSQKAFLSGTLEKPLMPLATREIIVRGADFDELYQRHLNGENLLSLAYEVARVHSDVRTLAPDDGSLSPPAFDGSAQNA